MCYFMCYIFVTHRSHGLYNFTYDDAGAECSAYRRWMQRHPALNQAMNPVAKKMHENRTECRGWNCMPKIELVFSCIFNILSSSNASSFEAGFIAWFITGWRRIPRRRHRTITQVGKDIKCVYLCLLKEKESERERERERHLDDLGQIDIFRKRTFFPGFESAERDKFYDSMILRAPPLGLLC